MGKPDTAMVESTYGQALTILEGAPTAIAQGIKLLINTVLAGLDFGVIGDLVEWAINIVVKAVCDMKAKALSIALRCEYMLRAGKVNFTTMKKAFNLTNKCSKCKCIGHNKTNHPTEIDTFLIDKQLDDLADAATDLVTGVDAAEQDGYWDWLSGTIM